MIRIKSRYWDKTGFPTNFQIFRQTDRLLPVGAVKFSFCSADDSSILNFSQDHVREIISDPCSTTTWVIMVPVELSTMICPSMVPNNTWIWQGKNFISTDWLPWILIRLATISAFGTTTSSNYHIYASCISHWTQSLLKYTLQSKLN